MGDDGDDGGFDRDAPGACDACQLAARAAARDRCAGLSAAPRTGAIFARRTEGTAAFAKDWLAALLDSSPKSRRPRDVGRRHRPCFSSCSDVWCKRNSNKKTARVAARPFAGRLGCVRLSGIGCRGPRGGFVVLHAAHITTLVEPPERALKVARAACRVALNGTTAWRLVVAHRRAARDLARCDVQKTPTASSSPVWEAAPTAAVTRSMLRARPPAARSSRLARRGPRTARRLRIRRFLGL